MLQYCSLAEKGILNMAANLGFDRVSSHRNCKTGWLVFRFQAVDETYLGKVRFMVYRTNTAIILLALKIYLQSPLTS